MYIATQRSVLIKDFDFYWKGYIVFTFFGIQDSLHQAQKSETVSSNQWSQHEMILDKEMDLEDTLHCTA